MFRLPRAVVASGLVLTVLLGAAHVAVAASMSPPPPYRAKDFTLVKKDGIYHLFYIRSRLDLPAANVELDFGHAISTDLHNWAQAPPVLAVRGSNWDRSHVWAPSIVEQDGVYYLFYTGVAETPGPAGLGQRIGVATSTDLYTWNRLDAPVLTCADVPWSVCDTTSVGNSFRDPFVMPDPGTPGRWLMAYVTQPATDPASMVVGVAASDGDLASWHDLTPLWITHRSWSYNDVVESPHLFLHEGTWFLLFTTNAGQPISYATASNPLAPPEEWVYRGRLANMLGFDTHSWFASETLRDGLIEYFAIVTFSRIQIYQMVWTSPLTFTIGDPDYFHVEGLAWNLSTVLAGASDTLAIAAASWPARSAAIEALEVRDDGTLVPLANAALGLPASVPLTTDTTRIAWKARIVHADGDTLAPLHLLVRTTDQTAVAPPVTVLPDTVSPPPPPPPPPPDPNPEPNIDDSGDPALRLPWTLRTLRNAPVSGRSAFLIQVPLASAARLDLYDPQGRRLRTLLDRVLPAGATVVAWDGRDRDGVAARPGVYFARLVTARHTLATRLVLLP